MRAPKVALRGGGLGFRQKKFQELAETRIAPPGLFAKGLGAASRHLADVERLPLGIQPILEGDDLLDL